MTDMERIIGTPQWHSQNDQVTWTLYWACDKAYMIFNYQERLS